MSIVATVIGVVILLLKKLVKRKLSPKANYMIWLVFLITLILPISIPSRISIYNCIDISNVKYVNNSKKDNMVKLWKEVKHDNENSQIRENANDFISQTNDIIWFNHIKFIVSYVWFMIFIAKLTKSMISYRSISRNADYNEVKDEKIILLLEECKKKLKIKRKIKIVVQDIVKTPSTIGVFHVKILVTKTFLELDEIALKDIFMHELAHYKRKDNVMNFMLLILKAVYWFNPMFKKIFKMIRNEMELATDEMAINQMNIEELRVYCKLMVAIAGMSNLQSEQLLGLSNGTTVIERRIDMISLQDEFEKNAKWIMLATVLIILSICFVLYPTSYGISKTPELYLQLENGDRIEVTNTEESSELNEITLTPDSKVDFIVKNGKSNAFVFYSKEDLNNNSENVRIVQSSRKILSFDYGEYIYQFTIVHGNNESTNYAVKIIVE